MSSEKSTITLNVGKKYFMSSCIKQFFFPHNFSDYYNEKLIFLEM